MSDVKSSNVWRAGALLIAAAITPIAATSAVAWAASADDREALRQPAPTENRTAPAPGALQPDVASIPSGANFILGGFHAGDWQFALGPTGAPEMALKLVRKADGGGIFFECRSDGDQTVAVEIPGLQVHADDTVRMAVVVGVDGHALDMAAIRTNAAGAPALLQARGRAVQALLSAMAKLDERGAGIVSFDDGAGHAVRMEAPRPRDLSRTASMVCHGWVEKAASTARTPGGLHKPDDDGYGPTTDTSTDLLAGPRPDGADTR